MRPYQFLRRHLRLQQSQNEFITADRKQDLLSTDVVVVVAMIYGFKRNTNMFEAHALTSPTKR